MGSASDDNQRSTRSTAGSAQREPVELTPDQRARLEARNGLLQFDLMASMIDEAVKAGSRWRLRISDILSLQRVATAGIQADAGQFRTGSVEISGSSHTPPDASDVPRLVEDMCDEVVQRWDRPPVHLASYVMWRLNWIHPFNDGNGRTSRAVSYLVLCAKSGFMLPGTRTIPQQIESDKFPYYDALDAADDTASKGATDLSKMEELLGNYLAAQLMGIYRDVTGTDPDAVVTDDCE